MRKWKLLWVVFAIILAMTSVAAWGAGNYPTSSGTKWVIGGTLDIKTVNAASGSANPIDYTGTLGIMDGSDNFTLFDINLTNANHTGASNYVTILDIAGITGDAQATETAVNVGTGWDYGINSSSPILQAQTLAVTDGVSPSYKGIYSALTIPAAVVGGTQNIKAVQGWSTIAASAAPAEVWGGYFTTNNSGTPVSGYGVVGEFDNTAGTPSNAGFGVLGTYDGVTSLTATPTTTGVFTAAVAGQVWDRNTTGPTAVVLAMVNGDTNRQAGNPVGAAFKAMNRCISFATGFNYAFDSFIESGFARGPLIADVRLANGETISNTSDGVVALSAASVKVNSQPVALNTRHRVTTAEANAGHAILPAIAGRTYRIVDCKMIAYGGAAATCTTVDVTGTQSSSVVKLSAFAQASLTQSTVLTMGGTGAAVLADGASYVACDANTAINVSVTTNNLATATGVDVILTYVIE